MHWLHLSHTEAMSFFYIQSMVTLYSCVRLVLLEHHSHWWVGCNSVYVGAVYQSKINCNAQCFLMLGLIIVSVLHSYYGVF